MIIRPAEPLTCLVAPPLGEDRVRHNRELAAWDETFGRFVTTINAGLDLLRAAGARVARLPDRDLSEWLVLPLTGDYRVIRQNADACLVVRQAVDIWAGNVAGLSLGAVRIWKGEAALAFAARMQALRLEARALGEVVARGSVVLDEVALFCERLAVRVERLVVALGKALARLARRLLGKVPGLAAAAQLAWEVARHGAGVVADIVADVELVLSIIDTLRELADLVASWAELAGDRLRVFEELGALVEAVRG